MSMYPPFAVLGPPRFGSSGGTQKCVEYALFCSQNKKLRHVNDPWLTSNRAGCSCVVHVVSAASARCSTHRTAIRMISGGCASLVYKIKKRFYLG